MRKFIQFTDQGGLRHELSPLTHEEFMSLDLYNEASDSAWELWLRHNDLVEIDRFRRDALPDSVIVVEFTQRDYEFNPSGDRSTWIKVEAPIVGAHPPGGGMTGDTLRAVNAILEKKYGAGAMLLGPNRTIKEVPFFRKGKSMSIGDLKQVIANLDDNMPVGGQDGDCVISQIRSASVSCDFETGQQFFALYASGGHPLFED
jgi:hypothetical protein